MKANSLYKQLKIIIDDNNYTSTQIRNIKKVTIETLLNTSIGSDAFFNNLKETLARHKEEEESTIDMVSLRNFVKDWISVKFPDAEFERGKENGSRFIKVWLDGSPY